MLWYSKNPWPLRICTNPKEVGLVGRESMNVFIVWYDKIQGVRSSWGIRKIPHTAYSTHICINRGIIYYSPWLVFSYWVVFPPPWLIFLLIMLFYSPCSKLSYIMASYIPLLTFFYIMVFYWYFHSQWYLTIRFLIFSLMMTF